jgi:iron-sulfur cluster assembly protein
MPEFLKSIPVSFSPLAKEHIHRIRQAKGISPEYGLRVGVKGGGGCGSSGMSYLLGFDKPGESDDHFFLDDLLVLVDKKHTMYLLGLEVDYITQDGLTGFTFVHPDQKQPVL